MNKTLTVAWREFVATVATKGFLFALGIMPAIVLIMIFGFRFLFTDEAPRIEGEVAVIDRTGEVLEGVREYLQPEAIAERRDDFSDLVEENTPEEFKQLDAVSGSPDARQQAIEMLLGVVPKLDVVGLSTDADLQREKEPLRVGTAKDGGRLALIVIHGDAVVPAAGEDRYGSYDLFVKDKLDDRIEDEIRRGLRDTIVDARVRHADLDRDYIESLTRVERNRSKTVTDEGEEETNEAFNVMLPGAFMLLLWIGVMTGGQSLMTTTVEEKSSRVAEVLLSAVSPMQLMSGKIIGQMFVGFLLIAVYASMGLASLFVFAMIGMLDPMLIVYLVLFYLISYFIVAAMLGSIGAAVNEMREAQGLMGPVMMVLMVPWLLWMPISRNPDSTFAVVTSFIPPLNAFVMMIRLSSTSPPPWWQVWLSILIGAVGVYVALRFAAKVFRIGLLMFGKAPNFRTLVRWVRMA